MELEQSLKRFAREHHEGLLVGIAGRERLHGPPSASPRATMRGARSVVAIALPMHVPAIYEFLSKKSPIPHNVDQARGNQRAFRISESIAGFLRERGFRAKAAPVNSDYRRSPDTLGFHPTFSHRYGALLSGIAGQGWSGNVVTREYGGAVYLGSVVTNAKLESDPMMEPQAIVDERCRKCKVCEKSCPVGMFERQREERFALGGRSFARGKRRHIHLCTASCFGMHALSRDKRWTSWGAHWIDDWIDGVPDPTDGRQVRRAFARQAYRAGDSGMRAMLIRRVACRLLPEETLDVLPEVDAIPADEMARARIQKAFASKLGLAGLENPNVLTCGHCSIVCGPTLEERAKRLKLLQRGGLVVRDAEGRMVAAASYEDAQRIRQASRRRPSPEQRERDRKLQLQYARHYLGFDLPSEVRGVLYEARARLARFGRSSATTLGDE
ncbi:MAG: hypothetical protein JRI23_19955 [Deltaproteobacteria bacterium]|nr:hypothetical protein [Deltaproteobacteria bacterium]MBW2534147.1 hypothetical protein [Deltaproteobacteria bacterium]